MNINGGLVDGTGMIPEETPKQHTHDYDQVLWFLSSDPNDMLHLGAELEVDLGETGIRHRMATPHAIYLPKGTPHFSPIVKSVDRPFFFISLNIKPGTSPRHPSSLNNSNIIILFKRGDASATA